MNLKQYSKNSSVEAVYSSDLGSYCDLPSYAPNRIETATQLPGKSRKRGYIDPAEVDLNRFSFHLPRMGEKPNYCGVSKASEIAIDGSGIGVTHNLCHRALCPSCGALWEANKVFRYSFLVEAYAMVYNQRPAVGHSSLDPLEDYTLKDVRKFRRDSNRLLKKGGVDAGLSMLHPYRIKGYIADAIKEIISDPSVEVDSHKLWKFIKRDDSLQLINEHLNTEFTDYRSLVKMGIHNHLIMFPNWAQPTGNKSLFVRKWQYSDGSIQKLASLDDVIKNVYYLVSHVGLSDSNKFELEPVSPMGGLHKFKPSEHLTDEQITDLKQRILDFMNEGRDREFVYDSVKDELVYTKPEDEDKPEVQPIGEFLYFNDQQKAYVEDYIETVFTDTEAAEYVKTVVELFNELHSIKSLNGCYKHAYTCLLPPPPSTIKVYGMDDAPYSQSNYDKLQSLLCEDQKRRINASWSNDDEYEPVDIPGFMDEVFKVVNE